MHRKVLVAGAHGVIGRAAAIRLAAQPDTEVFGLSRRVEPSIANVQFVSVDLLQPALVAERLSAIRGVTHVVFAAYIEKQSAAEKSEVNAAILRKLLDAVEATSPGLQHITFYQGGKAYGSDLGPFKTHAARDVHGRQSSVVEQDGREVRPAADSLREARFLAIR
jgi:nucleoside-diphosphate-sugar epimerase